MEMDNVLLQSCISLLATTRRFSVQHPLCNQRQLVKTLLQMQLRKLVGEYTFLPSGFHFVMHGDLPHTMSHLQNLVRGHVTAKNR